MRPLDCRLDHIQGMEHEKERCSALLATAHPSNLACAVLAIPGTELYYAQCNFRFEDDDPGCFKMLQPLGYLRHAWAELAKTHQLVEIHCLDQALSDHLRANPIRTGNGTNLVVHASCDADGSMPVKAKPAETRGLFDWLTRLVRRDPEDWLDNLEAILERYRHDDFIDAAILHAPLKDTRLRLWKESLDASKADDDARLLRSMQVFVGLGRCTTEAREWAWLHAQCIRGAYEQVGDVEMRRRLGAWVSVSEALTLRAGWALLEIPNLTAMGHIDGFAENYFHVMEETSTWRTYSNDPNELPRLIFGMDAFDQLRKQPLKAEPIFEVEWGEWCEVVAKPWAAEMAYLAVKAATESSTSRHLLRARVRALVGLARIRILRKDSQAGIDEALDALDQTLIGPGECLGTSEVCLYTARLARWRLIEAWHRDDSRAIESCYSVFQDRLGQPRWRVGFNSAACKCEQARIHRIMAIIASPASPQRDEHLLQALEVLGEFLDTPPPPSSRASSFFSIDCHVERLETCAIFMHLDIIADSTRDALALAAHRSMEALRDQSEVQFIALLKLFRHLKGYRYSLMGRLNRLLEAWPSEADEASLDKFYSAAEAMLDDTVNERPPTDTESAIRPSDSSTVTATPAPASQRPPFFGIVEPPSGPPDERYAGHEIRVATLDDGRPDWRFVAFVIAPGGRHSQIHSEPGARYSDANLAAAAGRLRSREAIDASLLADPLP